MLSKIFSGGAAELVKGVGGVIDNLHTSKEEKLEAERKIKELMANYQVEMEKNITSRWEADLKSDSWLSKNVRPLVLVLHPNWQGHLHGLNLDYIPEGTLRELWKMTKVTLQGKIERLAKLRLPLLKADIGDPKRFYYSNPFNTHKWLITNPIIITVIIIRGN